MLYQDKQPLTFIAFNPVIQKLEWFSSFVYTIATYSYCIINARNANFIQEKCFTVNVNIIKTFILSACYQNSKRQYCADLHTVKEFLCTILYLYVLLLPIVSAFMYLREYYQTTLWVSLYPYCRFEKTNKVSKLFANISNYPVFQGIINLSNT